MNTLQNIWLTLFKQGYETDKGSVHSYIEVYEEILAPYRNTALNILEIGIFKGNSLRMWQEYFTGEVHGIDCDTEPIGGMANLKPMIDTGEYNIYIFNAESSEEAWEHFGDRKFDVIIEDAGHNIEQQLQMYRVWREYLSPGGVYIIEDIQDIDRDGHLFVELGGEVIDRRHIKNRYDDVLVIFRP